MATTPDRPYKNRIHREDLLLYIVSVVLISFFIAYFVRIQQHNDKPVFNELDTEMFKNLQLKDPEQIRPEHEFLKAQLQLVYKRYELTTKVSRTIAYIKFIGFIVGTLLVLLGTMVVIRGIRHHDFNASGEGIEKFRFSLSLSSPGMFLCLIGTIIMIATILKGVENKMDDVGIAYPNQIVVQNPSADSATRTIEVVGVLKPEEYEK